MHTRYTPDQFILLTGHDRLPINDNIFNSGLTRDFGMFTKPTLVASFSKPVKVEVLKTDDPDANAEYEFVDWRSWRNVLDCSYDFIVRNSPRYIWLPETAN